MNTLKVWHHGTLKTEAQAWADETPYETYRAADRRMSGDSSPAERESLHRRWPMLIDAINAQSAAFRLMTPEQRADDLARVEADLALIELGL